MNFVYDLKLLPQSGTPVINYSHETIEGAIQVLPHGILHDFGIKDYTIEVSGNVNYTKIFFKNQGKDVPFDILAASFWLISRYEEYIPHKTDNFNRFHYKTSLAYQYDFLHVPLVNLWLTEFIRVIQHKFPSFEFGKRDYNFISTIDVDNAFKYKYKGFVRSMAGYLRDIAKRNYLAIKKRTSIILGQSKDPFDCYDFLVKTNSGNGIKAVYFFLLGDYGVNDKNHSAGDLRFQSLIKHLADYSFVGIHPSFGSNNNLHQLKVEVSRLANIIHKPVSLSRQHFSMLKFPETYNALLQSGVDEDYSMGFTNINGFRASFCYPFKWYNLEEEHETSLLINPFMISENTVSYFSKKQNVSFMSLVEPFVNEVKKYNGQMISVFHNDTFNDEMRDNYISFLQIASAKS